MSAPRVTRKSSGRSIPDEQRARPRLSLTVERAVYNELQTFCEASRSSESAVVELALREFFGLRSKRRAL